MGGIVYQNKDIASKIFAENLKGRSFEVYGLCLPEIKDVVSLNLPAIIANERRVDELMRLADGSFALVDFESGYADKDKLDYLTYGSRILERIWKSEDGDPPKLRIIIIYTGDVKRKNVRTVLNTESISLKIEPAFLSELDGTEIIGRIQDKLYRSEELSDPELMELGIFPLSFPGKEKKREMTRKAVELAKQITDKRKQMFALCGLIVFTDKVLPDEDKQELQRWMMMTTIGRMFEEEKQKAIREATAKVRKETRRKTRRETREKDSQLVMSEGLTLDIPKDKLQLICEKLMKYPGGT